MAEDILNGVTLQLIRLGLDGLSLRQQVIAHNIANADTPGYQAQAVTFEEALQRQMKAQGQRLALVTTHPAHLRGQAPILAPQVVSRPATTMRPDGNNVDIDLEMSQLAETTIRYQALTQLAARKLALLKAAVTER